MKNLIQLKLLQLVYGTATTQSKCVNRKQTIIQTQTPIRNYLKANRVHIMCPYFQIDYCANKMQISCVTFSMVWKCEVWEWVWNMQHKPEDKGEAQPLLGQSPVRPSVMVLVSLADSISKSSIVCLWSGLEISATMENVCGVCPGTWDKHWKEKIVFIVVYDNILFAI